jgi:hypothetical protein
MFGGVPFSKTRGLPEVLSDVAMGTDSKGRQLRIPCPEADLRAELLSKHCDGNVIRITAYPA